MAEMRQNDHIALPFLKMHGLGNDFVVIDAREQKIEVSPALARALGDRHRGVGFDQLAVMAKGAKDLHLTFYNSDGSVSAACGNATRCIARHVMDETGQSTLTLTTDRGTLQALDAGNGLTSVNMGHPQLLWHEIPLAEEMDTLALPIDGAPTATGMGNPHCTFFVEDLSTVDVPALGARHEHHRLFPQRTNVQAVEVVGQDHLRMKVWERGVGMTLASGSSSCAVAVAAARRGFTGRDVRIDLDGGTLQVAWKDDGVWMTGPTQHVFSGTLTQSFLDALT
jgi:diaminopimelate epimerase